MKSDPPQTLAELETVHKNVSNQVNAYSKEHGNSHELRTLRVALLHLEERMQKLRDELQEGVQEINKEIANLSSAIDSGVREIKNDVRNLNNLMHVDLNETEKELKDSRSTN